jgi:cold shock CspA family protein/uncharacterized LabA/DUF88 family protein
MKNNNNSRLRRIGVFYDGNYFLHVSNYYNYVHERKTRISIAGLHDFIRHKVAEFEGDNTSHRHCQIVDAHYFRGRLAAGEASQRGNQLYFDRVFDDILMHEGVTTHYLPVRSNLAGGKYEKGIDVWLALETLEQAFYKNFDLVVLVASDGDYVQLCRKLNTLGCSVMLLSWDFEFTDDYGNTRVTRTSQDLLNIVTYPVAMHELIENRVSKDKFLVNNLFVPKEPKPVNGEKVYSAPTPTDSGICVGEILSMKQGYGFIKYPPNNLFFHHQNLNGVDFNELHTGAKVQFEIAKNDDGDDVAINVELMQES